MSAKMNKWGQGMINLKHKLLGYSLSDS